MTSGQPGGRMRIRERIAAEPPKPFKEKIKTIRRLLAVAVTCSALMMIGIVFAPIEEHYNARGVVRPAEYRTLYASADLDQREAPDIHEGQAVKKGDVLMKFHLPAMEKEIASLRQDVANGQAELDVATTKADASEKMPLPSDLWEIKEQLAKSESSVKYYDSQLKRSEALFASGDMSARDVEKAKLEYEQARIENERLKQRFDVVQGGYREDMLKQARATEKQVETRLAMLKERLGLLEAEYERLSVLRAPEDGFILDVPNKYVIGTIKSGDKLLYMAVGDKKVVEIFGSQKNSDKVQVGQVVRFKSEVFDSMMQDYAEGKVVKVGQIRTTDVAGDTGTAVAGQGVGKYYPIIATVDKQPRELRLDSNVQVQVVIRKDFLYRIMLDKR
jgi:multidrug efflux pump subunit AcrA (membrane-fusion protein)